MIKSGFLSIIKYKPPVQMGFVQTISQIRIEA